MINFVKIEKGTNPKWLKIRKMVVSVSTIVLIIYVVGLSAWVGIWWYTVGLDRRVSAELQSLTDQSNSLATREVLVRQLFDRSKIVLSEISSPKLSDLGAKLQDPSVAMIGWDNTVGLKTSIGVAGADPKTLQAYSQKVKGVQVGAHESLIAWNKTAGWVATLTWEGGK